MYFYIMASSQRFIYPNHVIEWLIGKDKFPDFQQFLKPGVLRSKIRLSVIIQWGPSPKVTHTAEY